MKFKIKLKRKIFLKKTTWLVLALFGITMVYIPKLKASADSTGEYSYKILEIAPGNSYDITNSSNKSLAPTVENWSDGTTNLQITHMDMAQYNSMVDDIAGIYDAVVISNNLTANSAMNTTDTSYPYHVDLMYRMYSAPTTQGTTVAKYLNTSTTNPLAYAYSGKTINGKSVIEYYPENDITTKRANNLVDMINKGQAVYFDNSILNNQSIKLTTLVGKKSGVKVKTQDWLTIANLANDLKAASASTRRPKVTSITGPTSEVRKPDGTVTPNRNLQFAVNADSEGADTLTINLYLDINADGMYSDNEKFPIQLSGTNQAVKDLQVPGTDAINTYNFSCQMYNSFIGFLNWKVDVVRSNGVKSSTIGNVTMKSINGKKQINVLQIYPNSDTGTYYDLGGKTSNTRLDLADQYNKNSDFSNVLSQVDDYDIKIDPISVDQFQSQYGAAVGKKHLTSDLMTGTKTTGTNGYDMVIVGFADSYRNVDFANNDALADLDNFIKANRSVMFTHDTMSLASASSVLNTGITGSTNFTNHYRDIIGQARYADPLRGLDSNNQIIETDLNGNKITHDLLPSGQVSLGETPLAINGPNNVKLVLRGTRLWESTLTTKIKSINNAQISSYPFNLTNLSGNNDGQVNVSLTHTQWYQLDLEDPNVVPWYNLVQDTTKHTDGTIYGQMDSGDSRNFYYTYSKKNITYSGTGHSGVGDSVQEFELFVNTIVKAQRGSDSPPVVTNMSLNSDDPIADGSTVPDAVKTDDYKFRTKLEDTDNDKIKVSINADGSNQNVKIAKLDGTIVNQGDQVDDGTILNVTILKDAFTNKNYGDTTTVVVNGVDPDNAKDTKSFKIPLNNAPTIVNQRTDGSDIGDGSYLETVRTSDYSFITIPSDVDSDDTNALSLSVKMNGNEVGSTDLTIDGNAFDSTTTKVTSDSKVQVKVPQSELNKLAPGNKDSHITIVTEVTDTHGAKATKTLYIYAESITPQVSHGVYSSNAGDGGVTYSSDTVFTQGTVNGTATTDWYNKVFAGMITQVYDKNPIITLTLDSGMQISGNMPEVYKFSGGTRSKVGDMTGSDGTYTYNGSLSDAETVSGVGFVIIYKAKIAQLPSDTTKTYTNTLTITNGNLAQVTTSFKKITIASPDLF